MTDADFLASLSAAEIADFEAMKEQKGVAEMGIES